MNISVIQGEIQSTPADAIIVNLFDGVTHPGGATGAANRALGGLIAEVITAGDFKGKLGETLALYPRGQIPAQRVIVVGLGKAADFSLEGVREASGAAIKQARKLGAARVATIVHGGGIGGLDVTDAAQAVVEGSLLALYTYPGPPQKTEDEPEKEVAELALVEFDGAKLAAVEAGARAGQIIAGAAALARTLVNRPGNFLPPAKLAEAVQDMAAETGLSCTVLEESDMQSLEMGALLAVTQGSAQPAKFIVLEHAPDAAAGTAPAVLVGKGVTFDTGGYSLKTQAGMTDMHGDMGGAAAVIGAMQAVARLELPLRVIGLIPTVENMISGSAYKLRDVVTAKNGKSIEIFSTDAEGRLILADALCYAGDLNPAAVIDVATLTGGKVVALGNRTSALFANPAGQSLAEALRAAGQLVGEPLWPMPLDPAYDRQIKSEVADLRNTGGRSASSVTAARFLAHFTGDWPWLHVDIASGEFYTGGREDTPRSYLTKGATGVPMRALVQLLRHWK